MLFFHILASYIVFYILLFFAIQFLGLFCFLFYHELLFKIVKDKTCVLEGTTLQPISDVTTCWRCLVPYEGQR